MLALFLPEGGPKGAIFKSFTDFFFQNHNIITQVLDINSVS